MWAAYRISRNRICSDDGRIHISVPACATLRIQNPNTLWASRFEAAHGGTARRGGAEKDGTPFGQSDLEITLPLAFQRIENTVLNDSSEERTV